MTDDPKHGEIIVAPDVPVIDPMISMIERVVMDPGSDLAKLEKMLEMKEKHLLQQAKASAALAFAEASAEFPEIPLNGLNEHTKKPYALLKDIISHTRPVLSAHGLALSFSTEVTDKDVIVTAELSHKDGHTKTNSLPLPRDTGAGRNAVQSVGSSQTYGQRYTAQAILGLSLGEDTEDDGRGSGASQKDAPKKQYSWADTVIQDLPESATSRDKAEAISSALCSQWKRMKGERQMHNEWDRRATIISGFEEKHPDLHTQIIDAYEIRIMEITGQN